MKIDSISGDKYIIVNYDQATNKFTYNDQSYTQDELQKVLQNDLSLIAPNSGTTTIENTQQIIEGDANTVEQIAQNSDGTPAENIVNEAQKTISENEDAIDAVAENNDNNSSENTSEEVDSIAESNEQAAQEAEKAVNTTVTATEREAILAEENSDLAAVEEIVAEFDENVDASNLDKTEATINEAISQAEQETGADNQNQEESDKLEKPDGAQEILDEEMDRALSVDKGEIKTREPEKTDAQRKFERQQKMDKAVEIGSTILEAGSQGLQAYSAIQNLMASPEQEEQRNVLHLSNMKKGKSLIRKIKKRRAAFYGYATK